MNKLTAIRSLFLFPLASDNGRGENTQKQETGPSRTRSPPQGEDRTKQGNDIHLRCAGHIGDIRLCGGPERVVLTRLLHLRCLFRVWRGVQIRNRGYELAAVVLLESMHPLRRVPLGDACGVFGVRTGDCIGGVPSHHECVCVTKGRLQRETRIRESAVRVFKTSSPGRHSFVFLFFFPFASFLRPPQK